MASAMVTTITVLFFLVALLLVTPGTRSDPGPDPSTTPCDPGDQKILLDVKAGFTGGNIYLQNWDPTVPNTTCCNWYGVTCDSAGRTRYLNIRKIPDLTGPIPRAIGRLTNLAFLSLDWNNLTGPVPDFLGRLPLLYYLNLSFNRLSGRIPAALGTYKALTYIRLDRNQLTGRIPDSLANTPATTLYLSHNNLTGPIPASFAAVGFTDLDLSRNRLTGDASLLFGAKKPLGVLDLSRNLFEFNLTAVVFPDNLDELDINHNMIYGSIPQVITKPDFIYINVSYNRLCGEIPFGGRVQELNDEYSFLHNKCLCGAPLPACK